MKDETVSTLFANDNIDILASQAVNISGQFILVDRVVGDAIRYYTRRTDSNDLIVINNSEMIADSSTYEQIC